MSSVLIFHCFACSGLFTIVVISWSVVGCRCCTLMGSIFGLSFMSRLKKEQLKALFLAKARLKKDTSLLGREQGFCNLRQACVLPYSCLR